MVLRTPLTAIACLLLSLLICCPTATLAEPPGGEERILDFASQVEIRPDASLLVTETIRIVVLGQQLKRGLVREIPNSYVDRQGRRVQAGLKIISVWRDGEHEHCHIEAASNGLKLYIGKQDYLLPKGIYTYRIVYQTDRQIGYFDDYDELYWNATGNGWSFTIERARAEVLLPPGAKVVQQAAYTGPAGARGKDFTYTMGNDGRPTWQTTKPLRSGQGLTFAVAWPKGLVHQPDAAEKLMAASGSTVAGAAGLLLALVYFLLVWLKVGRDPQPDTIIPLFEPPEGLSPAAVRFVSRMGFDATAVSAAVISMAAKGWLTIKEDPKKKDSYTLCRTGQDPGNLSPGELVLSETLFSEGDSLKLDRLNQLLIGKAVKKFREALTKEYEKVNFKINRAYLWPGILLMLISLVAMVRFSSDPNTTGGMIILLVVWSAICYALSKKAVRAWSRSRDTSGNLLAMGATAFAAPFALGSLGGLYLLGSRNEPLTVLVFLCLMSLIPLFAHLLKAPTVGGQRLMGRIAGFKMYLSKAETARLNTLYPPEMTPELFERYLAYAFALGVEQHWAQQFDGVVEWSDLAYQAGWYSGRAASSRCYSAFTDQLSGSFSQAINSSYAAPGTIAGSGGGGFSGGGGGGGGGGGW